jgi:hypothetical protein
MSGESVYRIDVNADEVRIINRALADLVVKYYHKAEYSGGTTAENYRKLKWEAEKLRARFAAYRERV